MLHKLKVPALLRKSLHSTNPIESMFSMVRSCERNIKRYRSSQDAPAMARCRASALRATVQTSQGARIHRRGRCCHRCDPSRGRDAWSRLRSGA